MNQKTTLFRGLKVVALSALPVFALLLPSDVLQAEAPNDLFAKLDRNGNGVVEADEVGTSQKTAFNHLLRQGDTNEDGKISLQEFRQATTPEPKQSLESKMARNQRGPAGKNQEKFAPEKIFGFLDTNKDGKLTRAELPERAKERMGKLFERLGKEEITRTEFLESVRKFRQQTDSGSPKPGEGRSKEMFKRLDANKDRTITIDEVPEKLRPVFQRIFRQAEKNPEEGLTLADLEKYASNGPAGKFRFFKGKTKK